MTHQSVPLLLIDAQPPLEICHEVVAAVFDGGGGRFGTSLAAVEQCRHGEGPAAQSLLLWAMSMLLTFAIRPPCTFLSI